MTRWFQLQACVSSAGMPAPGPGSRHDESDNLLNVRLPCDGDLYSRKACGLSHSRSSVPVIGGPRTRTGL